MVTRARSLPVPLILLILLVGLGGLAAGCSDPDDRAIVSTGDRLVEGSSPGSSAIRGTADPSARRERYQSRIGPQPWPGNLPDRWPTPEAAMVLADTRRGGGGRLLLVDLPVDPERALALYRDALHRGGFETQRPRDPRLRHALHVHRDDEQAVLTFLPRADATRLEIFFVGSTPG